MRQPSFGNSKGKPALLRALVWSTAATAFLTTLVGSTAMPGGATALAAPAAKKLDLERIKAALASTEEGTISDALTELKNAGKDAKAAVPLLVDLLHRGSTAKILGEALETSSAIADAALSSAVASYVQHRVPTVRWAAARALVKTAGPDAVHALRAALRSGDPAVRGIAAAGLGDLGAKETVAELIVALDRQVLEAAESIGKLCDDATCGALAERLGKFPLDRMIGGFDGVLLRAPKAVSEELKIAAIQKIGALQTPDAAKYLLSVATRWPKGDQGKARAALRDTIEALGEKDPGPKAPEAKP